MRPPTREEIIMQRTSENAVDAMIVGVAKLTQATPLEILHALRDNFETKGLRLAEDVQSLNDSIEFVTAGLSIPEPELGA